MKIQCCPAQMLTEMSTHAISTTTLRLVCGNSTGMEIPHKESCRGGNTVPNVLDHVGSQSSCASRRGPQEKAGEAVLGTSSNLSVIERGR